MEEPSLAIANFISWAQVHGVRIPGICLQSSTGVFCMVDPLIQEGEYGTFASSDIEAGAAIVEIHVELIFTPAAALSSDTGQSVLRCIEGQITAEITQTIMYMVMIQQACARFGLVLICCSGMT